MTAQRNVDIIRNETIPVLGPIVITCIFTFLSVGNSTTLIIAATCLVMLFIAGYVWPTWARWSVQ